MSRKPGTKPPGQIRQSQIITTFGPGAMVDLPKQSVLVGGLDHWSKGGEEIVETRLTNKLATALQVPRSGSISRRRSWTTLPSPRPASTASNSRSGLSPRMSSRTNRARGLPAAGPPQGTYQGKIPRPQQKEAVGRPPAVRPGLPLRPYRGHRLVLFRPRWSE